TRARVKVVAATTNLPPTEHGSYASRVTLMARHATLRAAEAVKKQIAEAAAKKMGCEANELEFRDDVVRRKGAFAQNSREPDGRGRPFPHGLSQELEEGSVTVSGRVEGQILRGSLQQKRKEDITPKNSMSFEEAVVAAIDFHGALTGTGSYAPPPEARGGKHKGAGVGPSPAYSYSAQVAEVSVDEDTGEV